MLESNLWLSNRDSDRESEYLFSDSRIESYYESQDTLPIKEMQTRNK